MKFLGHGGDRIMLALQQVGSERNHIIVGFWLRPHYLFVHTRQSVLVYAFSRPIKCKCMFNYFFIFKTIANTWKPAVNRIWPLASYGKGHVAKFGALKNYNKLNLRSRFYLIYFRSHLPT